LQAAEVTPGLLERGAEIEEKLGFELEYHNSPRVSLARLLIQRGELDDARAIFEEVATSMATRGDEGRGQILWELSFLEWLAGRWQSALEHITVAQALAEQTQGPAYRAINGRHKALIEADLGFTDAARATVNEMLVISRAIPSDLFTIVASVALG